jgi:hypothetical protein
MHTDYYVYEHRRSDNGATFYVGKGRAYRAWCNSRRSDHWKVVAADGFSVHFLQKDMTEEDAFVLERKTIADYGLCALVNKTHGGEGGGVFTEETRQIMREKATGRPSFWKGKKRPPETIEKMSQGIRGEKHPRWGLKGELNPLFGKTLSDEHKAALSKARKGKKNSPEARAKISQKKKGSGHHMFDHTIYDFVHEDGHTWSGTQFDFRKEHGFQQSQTRTLVKGLRKSSLSGWRLA